MHAKYKPSYSRALPAKKKLLSSGISVFSRSEAFLTDQIEITTT